MPEDAEQLKETPDTKPDEMKLTEKEQDHFKELLAVWQ